MLKQLLSLLNAIFFFWILSVTPTALANPESAGGTKTEASPAASNYPLFFVTNRRSKQKNGTVKFSDQRSDQLIFGEYLRTEPADSIKESKMILFESEHQFIDALSATGAKKAAVFVHGYRKSFAGSMDFGLQMAKHLDAPLVVYAWPSKNNYCAYMSDECTAEWSSQQLARVLGDLGKSIGYHNIAIVSHSLGARMVQWSLKDLYAEQRPSAPFAASLFFSPDVDRGTFLQDAHFLKQACSTCRVYLDKHDTRIWISKILHGSPRVGSRDQGASQTELSQIFQYDTSLPNHHIPFDLVAESVHRIEAGNQTISN